ncbi:baseplate J/gp47 family protein [Cronobacter sakazakii]|nr:MULTISPECIES: baseplate J/gp47 family protein [Cronobacter]AGE86195.1 tail protein [Cronobacter sakazakii SP291]ALB50818.1 phage baseplate protein [Cronobacter sakazakii]EGT4407593.1 phage baseplate protein [Cronobacter sakazakii]EGT4425050.1 phage baseplate protein [Cronobacter sakazakii]EGT4465297.1 phage baseplate protein [Cronobacter sakazakii]
MADSGFSRPDLPNLIATIRSDLLTRFETDVVLRRLDAEVYSRVMAAAVHTLYGYLDYLARNMLPDLADEEWLSRHGNLKQVPRKQATTASGYARWESVSSGITLPAGTEMQTDEQKQYVTTADATVNDEGVLRALIEAVDAGTGGNLDDKTPLRLMTPVAGLSSTCYAESVEGGTDLETLEDWRSRIMARWYYTPQGGADADYRIWATDVAGITRAWVFRHHAGRGTVGVMPANSDLDNPVPDETLIDAVKQYILPLAPVAGSGLFVFPPTLRKIDFEIALAKDTPAIRAAVTKEIKSALFRDGEPSGKIYLSRISEAISLATDQFAHRLISPAKDVELGTYELPVIGEITWSNYNESDVEIDVALNSFSPNPVTLPDSPDAFATATFTPENLPSLDGVNITWDFVPAGEGEPDPSTLCVITPSADNSGVKATGIAPGTVHVRVTVEYKGKTATDNSYLDIEEVTWL